jgi:hypothetical protein
MFPTITAEEVERVCDTVLTATGAREDVAAAAPGGAA